MFYGWTKVDAFFEAWKEAGFQPVGHIVFRKTYSSKSRFLSYQHEQAYPAGEGQTAAAEAAAGRRDGYAVQRQQAASDAEAGRGVGSSGSQLHVAR